jgi:outer membrane beta-barrel protein
MMSRVSCLLAMIAGLLVAAGLDQTAHAEVKDGVMKRLAETDPVRRRQMMRKGRAELGVALGSSTGEIYQTSVTMGLQANYYLSDSFGVGAYAAYGLNFDSDLAEKVKAARGERVVEGGFSGVGVLASAEAIIVPAYGKASLLGVLTGKYDLNISLGAGGVQVQGADLEKFAIAPMVGLGARFFLNEMLAVNVQLRDYIYPRAQNALIVKDASGMELEPLVEESWMNHFFLTATFSLFTGKPSISP